MKLKKKNKYINKKNLFFFYFKKIILKMYKLECSYQTYAWGQPSQKSLVTKILRKNKIEIDESKPFAEYWMGTHINGPSK